MLLFFIIISAFSAATCTHMSLPPRERVIPNFRFIEGEKGGKDDYPPIVSLAYYFTQQELESQLNISVKSDNYDHFCCGTIVHSQWVLTAAHCLQDNVNSQQTSNIRIRVGFADLSMGKTLEPGEANFQIEKVVLHPEFDTKFKFADDLALVKVTGRFEGDGRVAKIATPDEDLEGEAMALGWGKTDSNIAALESLHLMKATDGICRGDWTENILEPGEKAAELRQQVLCFGEKSRRGGCYADSGGPLIVGSKKTLMGLASFVYEPCGEFSYYQKVSHQISWIEKTIGAMVIKGRNEAGAARVAMSPRAGAALGPNVFSFIFLLILLV